MSLPPLSQEQQTILDLVEKGHHIQIDAVAGSGKTTTSLWIAQKNPATSILLLTYNARLKLETRQKASALGLQNLEVHSYHAFCVKYWDPKAFTDAGILRCLDQQDAAKKKDAFPFTLVIVDEAQDMNPLYFRLVRRVVKGCKAPRLVVMGDRKQSIYAFNRADPRYLTLAPRLFGGVWKKAALSTSYRITRPMASFLNDCCQGALPLTATKDGARVRYVACSMYSARPLKEVEYYVKKGFAYDDMFVLAPSVKCSQSPVRILANRLTEKGIPVYVPTSDDEKLGEEVMQHKMVFSTFHQVKGLERAVVLVFDFSENYFRYYGKDLDSREIPNTLYVALTRARVGLTVFHDDNSPYASFLRRDRIDAHCWVDKSKRFREDRTLPFSSISSERPRRETSVAELLRYLPVDIVEESMRCLSVVKIVGEGVFLELPSAVVAQDNGQQESVREINAVAIPWYFEFRRTGTMPFSGAGEKRLLSKGKDRDENMVETLLRKSTEWVCQASGYRFKSSQIHRFDWLSESMLQETADRLSRCFDPDAVLEFQKEGCTASLTGTVSVWDATHQRAWSVSLSEARDEHFLQAALSAWLLGTLQSSLYVVSHDCRYEISWTGDPVAVVQRLLAHKEAVRETKSDGEFLAANAPRRRQATDPV